MKKHISRAIALASTLALLATTATLVAAQTSSQPYAGQQSRSIKAMSDDVVQGHLEGRGLGYAKAAELNHYPGPLHLRQLASELDLNAEQLTRIAAFETEMKAEAKRLGRLVVEKERALDQLFVTGRATASQVTAATVEIGRTKGELRAVHLNAHIKVRPLLSTSQVQLYDRLRGYGEGGEHMMHGPGHDGSGMKH
ncbi:MAG: Spy/CpxP family protein refolding chaperone [Rhodospirillales bacterium]|nr:Spy/CpxP family protein refolding chaperone [Rhodospirillales bacterium]